MPEQKKISTSQLAKKSGIAQNQLFADYKWSSYA